MDSEKALELLERAANCMRAVSLNPLVPPDSRQRLREHAREIDAFTEKVNYAELTR